MSRFDDLLPGTVARAAELQRQDEVRSAAERESKAKFASDSAATLAQVRSILEEAAVMIRAAKLNVGILDTMAAPEQPVLRFWVGYRPDPQRLDQASEYAGDQFVFSSSGGILHVSREPWNRATTIQDRKSTLSGQPIDPLVEEAVRVALDSYTARHRTA